MLRMGMMTDKGPIGVFGITDENILRLRAGMPLDIDLKSLMPPHQRINRVLIHYGATHVEILDDMKRAGLDISDEFYENARDLDDQLKRERLERGRQKPDAR